MALKTERILYVSRNFITGLTDVTANIERNGVSVATGVALSEVDAINFPGVYELVLSPTLLNSYGGPGYYSFRINSASGNANAPAVTAKWILANDNDDLETHISTVEGKIDTIDTEVGNMQSDVTSIKGTVEANNGVLTDASFGNSALKSLIDAVQSAVNNIQNSTRTIVAMPQQLVTPSAGINTYDVRINIFDTAGNLEDPDSNIVSITLQDESGNDRGNYMQGNTSGPKAATRLATGKYQIILEIPAGASREQINMLVDYTEASIALQAVRSANVVDEINFLGVATEATVQDILTDTADMQPKVSDIQTKINDATFGLSALKTALNAISALVTSTNTLATDAGVGFAALSTDILSRASQVSLNNLIATVDNDIKGAGFSNSTDSLKAISDRQFTGGHAI